MSLRFSDLCVHRMSQLRDSPATDNSRARFGIRTARRRIRRRGIARRERNRLYIYAYIFIYITHPLLYVLPFLVSSMSKYSLSSILFIITRARARACVALRVAVRVYSSALFRATTAGESPTSGKRRHFHFFSSVS